MINVRIHKSIYSLAIIVFCQIALADTHYVDISNPTPQSPYLTWSTAATNIQNAVDLSINGDTVLVSNGIYHITSQIVVTNAITLASVNGAVRTIVDADYSDRCFMLEHSQTILEGFSVVHGNGNCGAGIYCRNASIRECIIRDNQLSGTEPESKGGGVFIEGGNILQCQVSGNTNDASFTASTLQGGGIYCISSRVERCLINGNTIREMTIAQGAGIYADAGCMLLNSIIANNNAGEDYDGPAMGGGIYATSSNTIQNCTIVSNSANTYYVGYKHRYYWGNGGGVYFAGTNSVINSIVYHNICNYGDIHGPAQWSHSCTPSTQSGTGNITNQPELGSDFCLNATSPCIDAGSNAGAPTNDYFGVLRPVDGYGDHLVVTDIGATEFVPERSTPALLTNSTVTPLAGSVITDFDFRVDFSSTDQSSPVFAATAVNGTYYPMSLTSGSPNDGTYTCVTRLPSGPARYHFLFANTTGGMTRCPAVGEFTNVTVWRPITLSANSTTPDQGNTTTTFSFRVQCVNPDGTSLIRHSVVLNGETNNMLLENEVGDTATYLHATLLPAGTTVYHYVFNDGTGEIRFPESGTFVGPSVNSTQHYVSASGSHTWPFSTPATASTNIQEALAIANEGNSIHLTSGSYDIHTPVQITNSIRLTGPADGQTAIVQSVATTPCIVLACADAVVADLVVKDGSGVNGGGIICSNGLVHNCLVTDCEAERGGGIYLLEGTVQGTTVKNNTAINGGGLYIETGLMQNCTVMSNLAGNGAGVYVNDGEILSCHLGYNTATNVNYPNGGGGAYCSGGALKRSTLTSNQACYGGGVLCYNGGYIENCVAKMNHATSYGGGIATIGGYELQNCTIVDNSAGTDAGGVGLYGLNAGFMRNCIIVSNLVTGIENNYTVRDGLNISYSCVIPATNGSGNMAASPAFIDYPAGNYLLSTNSPCVDSGSTTDAPNVDLDGVSRPLDGNGDGTHTPDIGAYELIPNAMSLIRRDGSELSTTPSIRWMGYTNCYYSLLTTTNLTEPMTCVGAISNVPGCNAIMTYTGTPTAVEFFRIQAATNMP